MARREEGMEPVFERSGESGGYTFTDLHYPRFMPRPPLAALSTGLTPTRAHRQPTNCPVTHGPRCTRHRHDPQSDTRRGVPPPTLRSTRSPSSSSFYFSSLLFLLPVARAVSLPVLPSLPPPLSTRFIFYSKLRHTPSPKIAGFPRGLRGWTKASPMRMFYGSVVGPTSIAKRRDGGGKERPV